MIWSEMAVRLRAPGQGTDMVHRIVETLRDEISAGSLRGGSRITGEKQLAAILRVSRSTLREAKEKAVAADDVVAAALDIAPGENVSRRRRTYGISGRILAFADETAAGGGSHLAGRCAVAIDVVTDRSADWAAFFRKDEPL